MKILTWLGIFAGCVLAVSAIAGASERIERFHSEIVVNADGSMLVTETIRVRAAGDQIKRGIYRDFPMRYGFLFAYHVPFDVVAVQRDGRDEPFHTEKRSNGVRVYIGSESVTLPPGTYTYTLTYNTNRQLGFFEQHDELYWNVTGNDWGFVIDNATAEVILPAGIPIDQIHTEGYRGPAGSKDQNITSSVTEHGTAAFSAGRRLGQEEGLTIVVQWPRGHVTAPTSGERWEDFVRANGVLIVCLIGAVILILYYTLAWIKVGRDPEAGVIYPQYHPPANFSPAAVRYLMRMRFDNTCFTAAILSMAVKGYLRITERNKEYTLERISEDKSILSPGEQAAAGRLLRNGSIKLTQTNHDRIGKAVTLLKEKLSNELESSHFHLNRKWLIPGLVITLVAVVLSTLTLPGEAMAIIAFMSIWLTFWTIGVLGLLTAATQAWLSVFRGGGLGSVAGAVFLSVFSLPFLAGEVFAIWVVSTTAGPIVIPAFGLLAAINVGFYYLLKAPTLEGRKIMDQIEGFRMYLATAEADRLNQMKEPPRSVALFERLLPYAIALDVENQWAAKFEDVLKQAQQVDGYSPTWYHGSRWNTARTTAAFTSSLGGAFTSAISSSSRAPGSSSGSGGGGSSGGGGGGGGGGGW